MGPLGKKVTEELLVSERDIKEALTIHEGKNLFCLVESLLTDFNRRLGLPNDEDRASAALLFHGRQGCAFQKCCVWHAVDNTFSFSYSNSAVRSLRRSLF